MPYFIRQGGRHVSGPFDTAAVQEWVKAGRVTDQMELSSDRAKWLPALKVSRVRGVAKRRRRRRR